MYAGKMYTKILLTRLQVVPTFVFKVSNFNIDNSAKFKRLISVFSQTIIKHYSFIAIEADNQICLYSVLNVCT